MVIDWNKIISAVQSKDCVEIELFVDFCGLVPVDLTQIMVSVNGIGDITWLAQFQLSAIVKEVRKLITWIHT